MTSLDNYFMLLSSYLGAESFLKSISKFLHKWFFILSITLKIIYKCPNFPIMKFSSKQEKSCAGFSIKVFPLGEYGLVTIFH
jgi:preprotein translocase subunit SecG